MEKMFKIKEVIIFILIVIIIGGVVISIKPKKEHIIIPDNSVIVNTDSNNNIDTKTDPTAQQSINLCYYRGDKTTSGYYDIAWLKINTHGSADNTVTGEFNNLPSEKDSKIGTFEGTVGPVDKNTMARTADVWWSSEAEGMSVKEELRVEFGDGSATAGFGEMVNRGDGVYVYKDKTNLTYIKQMNQIDCQSLDEKLFTETYIRNNIKTIATNKPVLGGSWYVVSVVANPITHSGEVTYEDGHIQSKANFIYTYQNNPQAVTVTKFEVLK